MEEELFEVIGSFGRWQKIIYAILFYGNTVGVLQNYAITFLAPNVPFRCIEPSINISIRNDSEWSNECIVRLSNTSQEIPCTRWEYDTATYSDTLVNQLYLIAISICHFNVFQVKTKVSKKFDLVCDREWLISFAKSVYMIGFMLSVFVSGQLSDWIGRRPTMLICYVITMCGLFLSLFSNSIEIFLVFRFLQAFGRTGFTTTGYVLIMEMVGPKHRTNVGITIQLGWCCGFVSLVLVGYLFRDWFWFQVAIALPVLPLAIIFVLIPESPRWLLMRGRSERLKELIVRASKANKVELKEDADEIVKKLMKGRTVERKGTLLDLFRTPKMRYRVINMMYLWLVNAFVYYALSFNTNDLFGDRYINFLLVAILEFPSYGMLYLAMRWFGRRTITVSLMFLAGASCIALLGVPKDLPWLTTTLSQAGKFCVTASFGLLYLYTGELFPTVVRSAALGSCSTVARIGSVTAPFSRELGKATHVLVPNIVYSILAVTSGIFAFWLPETVGRTLPDTLDEGENAFEMKSGKDCQEHGKGKQMK